MIWTDIAYVLFCSLVVIYADFRMTKDNVGAIFNGLGAVPFVIQGKSLRPMQYRVFVPWLCSLFGHEKLFGKGMGKYPYIHIYFKLKWLGIVFALAASMLFFRITGSDPLLSLMLLSLFFILAAVFDYAESYFEVGFFALAFVLAIVQPHWWWAYLFLTLIAGLNKETAIFFPILFIIAGDTTAGAWSLIGFALSVIIPVWVYGGKPRYCKFNMIGENVRRIIESLKTTPLLLNEYMFFFVLVAVMATATIRIVAWDLQNAVEIVSVIMFVSLLVPSIWKEIRVFLPCVLGVIPVLVR